MRSLVFALMKMKRTLQQFKRIYKRFMMFQSSKFVMEKGKCGNKGRKCGKINGQLNFITQYQNDLLYELTHRCGNDLWEQCKE